MHPSYLSLLQTAAYFDLRYPWERKRSAKALRDLTIGLHAHAGAQAIFEIGAWEAAFSKAVRAHAPDARIYAFEANPFNYERFGSDPRIAALHIKYLHRAISDRSGPVEFYMQTRKGGSEEAVSRYAKSNSLLRQSRAGDYEAVTVEASTLRDIIEEEGLVGAPSTAWIDVEGAIQQVLSGLADRIDQFQLLHCEVEDSDIWVDQWRADDVFAYLADRGFVPVARDFERPHQFNVLFLRDTLLKIPSVRLALAQHYSGLGQSRLRWNSPRLWFAAFRSRVRQRKRGAP